MRRSLLTLLAFSAVLGFPDLGRAQVCLGGPALAEAFAANIGGGIAFFDGGKSYAASVTLGSNLFVAGGASRIVFAKGDDLGYFTSDQSPLNSVDGLVGYELIPSTVPVIHVCPTVGFGYGSSGLEDCWYDPVDPTVALGCATRDLSSVGVAPAVAIAAPFEISRAITLIAGAEVGVVYQRARVGAYDRSSVGALAIMADARTDTDTAGSLIVGLGLVLGQRVAFGPSLFVPFAADGATTSFGIAMALALGRRD